MSVSLRPQLGETVRVVREGIGYWRRGTVIAEVTRKGDEPTYQLRFVRPIVPWKTGGCDLIDTWEYPLTALGPLNPGCPFQVI